MSARHSTNGTPEPVAAYYRMSDDKQENSIERQRSQVEPYAARNGYVIVREYVDEGIAGDEAERRPGFMRMTGDAVTVRDFRVILCDDKDRFGRFDGIDFGYYVKPLRDARVRLETVAQGRVDWTSFVGRLTDMLTQEQKKRELMDNSRRVISEMLRLARRGRWLGGPTPHGYDLVPDPTLGKKLVPGDPEKVRTVRLIFALYDQGHSLDAIAAHLNAKGIPPPRGGACWNKSTIRGMLRCRKYVGDGTWNAGHDGKYSECRDGLVLTSDTRLRKRAVNPADDWVIVPDTHEAIIDRDLWERVQARLAGNRGRAVTASATRKVYPLAGLLVCGHCGWHMIGSSRKGGQKYYKCGKYHHVGKAGCHANHIGEDRVVRGITAKLQEVLLNPAVVKLVRTSFRKQAEDAAKANAPRLTAVRKQLATLEGKIAQGMERMSVIPADLLTEYAATVRGWKEERDRLRADIDRLERAAPVADLNKLLESFEEDIANLEDVLASADPVRLRSLLVEYVGKVELYFDHEEKPALTRSTFREGRLYVRQQQGFDLSCLLGIAASPTPAAPGAPRPGVPADGPAPG
jgi:site-specific DNA recombinase